MSENEFEEEELLVFMDFNTKIDEEIVDLNKEFKIIGLDTDNPIVQLSNQVYSGEWKDAIGTNVILEEDRNPPRIDPLFSDTPKTHLKYTCKTDKVLKMSRIFVKSQGGEMKVEPSSDS